jgi:predicted ester cyclase
VSGAEVNKAIVAAYLANVDRGNLEALREFSRPDLVLHLPGFPPLGLDAAIESGRSFRAAFLDLSHETIDLIAENDRVVLSTVIKGTHTASFQGLAPTGRPVAINVVTIFRLEAQRIAEIWELADLLRFFLQLGFSVQPPSQTGNGKGL